MNNNLLQIKFKERLNKLSSMDYDNVECWQIQEAFNKAQLEWVRRNLQGLNQKKELPEQTTGMIDNLQVLLTQTPFNNIVERSVYYETENIPDDYLGFVRVTATAVSSCCPSKTLNVYLGEEVNVETLLNDSFKRPDFEWAETFCTMIGNKVRIYTDGKFQIDSSKIVYYRKPLNIGFANCANIQTGGSFSTDVECEFKDDIVEVIIDEAVAILAGDVADVTNYQRNLGNSTRNT